MGDRNKVVMLSQRMIGGASEHIKVLGKELAMSGWDVSVAANWRPEFSPVPRSSFEAEGLTTYQIDFPSPRISRNTRVGPDSLIASYALNKLLRQEKPDVLHAHWRSILPFCLVPSCPPVIFTKHFPGATGWLSNQTYRIPQRMIAISSELRHEMRTQSHVPDDRIRFVLHGIDRSYAAPREKEKPALRRELGLPENAFIIVSVGRLVRQKDHLVTLAAMRQLRATEPRMHLVIVGDGPLREDLTCQVHRLDLQGAVTLTGHAAPQPYLDAGDVFVLSSTFEGFALAVVEAMMRGVPPVRTRTQGAIDQIEPGVSGLLFKPGDVTALLDAITLLAGNSQLRERMGISAQQRARALFTCEVMAKKTEQVYREVMK